MKTCAKCKIEQPETNFYKKSAKGNLNSYCKTCHNEYIKTLPKTETHKRTRLKIHLKRRYGITLIEYEQMLKEQNNVCAICKLPCTTRKRLAVDHCHITNQVRGLLCNTCNVGIGYLKHDTDILQSAITYLTKCYHKHLQP